MQRRTFIAASSLAAALAAPGAAGAAAPASGSAEFDREAFHAILKRPAPHKQVCASTVLQQGRVLDVMHNSLDAFAVGFGEGPGTLQSIAVLYGPSIALALDDTMWQKYAISKNLLALPKPDGVPNDPVANPYAADVAKLVASGASFFVCNNALRGLAGYFAGKISVAPIGPSARSAARDEFAAHMLPGVMIVPAGVAAITVAQEHRFALVQATL